MVVALVVRGGGAHNLLDANDEAAVQDYRREVATRGFTRLETRFVVLQRVDMVIQQFAWCAFNPVSILISSLFRRFYAVFTLTNDDLLQGWLPRRRELSAARALQRRPGNDGPPRWVDHNVRFNAVF